VGADPRKQSGDGEDEDQAAKYRQRRKGDGPSREVQRGTRRTGLRQKGELALNCLGDREAQSLLPKGHRAGLLNRSTASTVSLKGAAFIRAETRRQAVAELGSHTSIQRPLGAPNSIALGRPRIEDRAPARDWVLHGENANIC